MLLRSHAAANSVVRTGLFGSFGKYVTNSITSTVAASSRACVFHLSQANPLQRILSHSLYECAGFPAGIAHGHLLAHKATLPQHIPVRTMAGTKAENIVWSDSLLTYASLHKFIF